MNYYKLHHEDKDPWEFLKLKMKTPNASICDFCYKDVPVNTGKYVVHVSHICFNFHIFFTFLLTRNESIFITFF